MVIMSSDYCRRDTIVRTWRSASEVQLIVKQGSSNYALVLDTGHEEVLVCVFISWITPTRAGATQDTRVSH